MNVVRKFHRNRNSTTVTRTPPSISAFCTLPTARLMKSACWNALVLIVTSGGKRGFEAGQRLFDAIGDFERVGVRLLLDRGDDRGLHVEAAFAALERRAELSPSAMFLTRTGAPSRTRDDGVFEVFDRIDAPARADQILFVRPFEKSARSVDIGFADGLCSPDRASSRDQPAAQDRPGPDTACARRRSP